MVDNISLLDISHDENMDDRSMKAITLEEFVETQATAQELCYTNFPQKTKQKHLPDNKSQQ